MGQKLKMSVVSFQYYGQTEDGGGLCWTMDELGKINRTGDLIFFPSFLMFVYHIASHSRLAFSFIVGAMFLIRISPQFTPIHSQLPHLSFPPQVVQNLESLMFQVSFSNSFYLYHPRQVAMCRVCQLNAEFGRRKSVASALQPSSERQKRKGSRRNLGSQTVVLLAGEMSSLSCACLGPQVQFNVVVSAFSLSELPSKAERAEVVQTLWRKTSDFLVS